MDFEFVCHFKGHTVMNTLRIEEAGDFYEVMDAKLCSRCGKIITGKQTEESVLKNVQRYIHFF